MCHCVKVAMKLISLSKPITASAAASLAYMSPKLIFCGKKPRP
jgi:hypothetical protein